MRIRRLQIDGYKNIASCDVDFSQAPLINAIIGSNGSGKSNLLEGMLRVLVGVFFEQAFKFDFRFEYEIGGKVVVLQRDRRQTVVTVDGDTIAYGRFSADLKSGKAHALYPASTLVYYSGECDRIQKLIGSYRRYFDNQVRSAEAPRLRPLFVQSSNEQSKTILLALFAHGHRQLTDRLELDDISEVSIAIRPPERYNPQVDEPKLWGTVGAVRRMIAALDETSSSQVDRRSSRVSGRYQTREAANLGEGEPKLSERIYYFRGGAREALSDLAHRLERDHENLYLLLEHLRSRNLFKRVDFRLRCKKSIEPFQFEQLSEGEKQLLAVVGAIRLTNRPDSLVLLDEPDTHLNPHWSWDYSSMLTEAFGPDSRESSTLLMATHDPVMISGMTREQVLLAQSPLPDRPMFSRPQRNPRGQGVANLLCSAEFFGLPSSLDRETQKLLDERLAISVKPELNAHDKARLKALNEQIEILPGVSELDPNFVAFLRQRERSTQP